MSVCCVDGCHGIQEDIYYFEFPTSRSLRRKWLDVLNVGSKVPVGTVVCSQHFSREEYEFVRGKVRLKSKVVPTLLLQKKTEDSDTNQKPQDLNTQETSQTVNTSSVLQDENIVEKPVTPLPDPTTTEPRTITEPSQNACEESRREPREDSRQSPEICKVVNKNGVISSMNIVERDTIQPDPKQPPDFEDMITNYQIKNSKPHSLLPPTIEIEVPPASEQDGAIVVDDRGDAPPVFIEISVDKDNNTSGAGNEDCLMVLESVQVDVDPSSLLLPERDFDEEFGEASAEEERLPQKKQEPISLLTSSDDDDVIIEEPHIDTVEVSDETDEDNVPLVKLVKKRLSKRKSVKKKSKKKTLKKNLQNVTNNIVNNLLWNGLCDFYCVECQFSTQDSIAYTDHLKTHQKVLQVCSICDYTTASKTQFVRHLRKHKEEKRYKCHLCEYRAKHNMSLIYHMESHENGTKHSVNTVVVQKRVKVGRLSARMHACDQCDYVTNRKSDLKRHWTRKHRLKVYSDSDFD